MAKKQLSLTIDAELVELVDQMAKDKNQNRSECIEELLSKAVGDDGSGMVEFFMMRAHPRELMNWMHHTDVFNEAEKVPDGEDGLTELVLRCTNKRWKSYFKNRGKK